MDPDDWPDWLPADWTVQIRKIDQRKVKSYLDPKGQKFYSKPQVFRHLKTINSGTSSEKNQNADGSTGDISLEQDVHHTIEAPEPLSQVRATRLTSGSIIKKSKETDDISTGDGTPSKHGSSQRRARGSDWLPEGWTISMKTRESGSNIGMKYKCYTDPISGRKFFSKPQVMKYLADTNGSPAGQREGPKSSAEPEKSQNYEGTVVKKTRTPKNTESNRKFIDSEVISRTPADGLPPGWIKEVRLRKNAFIKKKDPYYLDPMSGYAFFSKLDALRYLDTGDVKNCAMRPLRRDINEEDFNNGNLTGGELTSPTDSSRGNRTSRVLSNGSVTKDRSTEYKRKARARRASLKDDDSDWPPAGWTTEFNVRDSGQKYKCFVESATGRKFYSKPQVLNYLANGNSVSRKRQGDQSSDDPDSSGKSASAGKRSKRKKLTIRKSAYEELVVTSPADGLPPGWIKEIRTRKYATHERSDPYYTDPVSGFIFRSKLDALRFLETGDVSLCAIRPRKKDADGNEIPVEGPTPASIRRARKQLFEENNLEKQNLDDGAPQTQILEENPSQSQVEFTGMDTAENANVSATPKTAQTRLTRRRMSSAAVPARTSKRLKGQKTETKTKSGSVVNEDAAIAPASHVEDGQEKKAAAAAAAAGTNVEKQVKTLTGEIPVNVRESSVSFEEESVGVETGGVGGGGVGGGVNETPTKVN